MNMKNIKLCILNVILPLLAGFIYYYLFCPDVILIAKIDSILKVKYHIQIPNTNFMVRFVRFYLLDALWAYALMFCLFIILGNTLTALKKKHRHFSRTVNCYGTATAIERGSRNF